MSSRLRYAAILALAGGLVLASAATESRAEQLPVIGPAADFALDTLDGSRLALRAMRGKVVVVAFVYAACHDVCPTEIVKLAAIGKRLGGEFGKRVHFVAITLDPEADSAAVLQDFAEAHGAKGAGWTFLSGTPAAIRSVAGDYGVVFRKTAAGEIEHNTVTSIVDRSGRLRVQYLGAEFDPGEMLRDIRSLLPAGGRR